MSDRQKIYRKKGTTSNQSNPSLKPNIPSLATTFHNVGLESNRTTPQTSQLETSEKQELAVEKIDNQENISLKKSAKELAFDSTNYLENVSFSPRHRVQRQSIDVLTEIPKKSIQRQELEEDKEENQENSQVVQAKLNASEATDTDKQESVSVWHKAFQIQRSENNKLDKPIESFNYLEKASIFRPKENVQRQELEEEKEQQELDGVIQAKCSECESEAQQEDELVQTKLTVGEPGDKYEQEADAVAAKVVEQINSLSSEQTVQGKVEPVVTQVMRQGGDSSTSRSSEGDLDQSSSSPSTYRIRVVGHASPRWRSPGESNPESLNFNLSEHRARAVEDALRSLFLSKGHPVEVELSCDVFDSDFLATEWRGMKETLEEAGGGGDANDSRLRRVDIEVDVLDSAIDIGGYSELVTLSTATTQWAIKVDIIEGALGIAGSMGQGELMNRDTGQTVRGKWIAGGGGGGIDLPIPSVSPGSWTNFETTSPLTFARFEDSFVRLSSVAAGVGIGYGWAEFSFTDFMDESVTLDGVTFNQWGIGGSVTAGTWHFTQSIPPPPTEVQEHDILDETNVGTQFGHRVLFSTGEDAISWAELDSLAEFVERLP